MSESEMTKKLTKAVKAIDKLVLDIAKDYTKVAKALRELKEHGEKKDKA